MIWRLEAMNASGVEGTVLGTLVMPYCSGLGNLVFAFLLGAKGDMDAAFDDSLFGDAREWGKAIQSAITATQLPGAAAAIDDGTTVHFGEIAMSWKTLTFDGRTYAWEQIQLIDARSGLVRMKVDGTWVSLTPVGAVPNFYIFNELAERLRQAAADEMAEAAVTESALATATSDKVETSPDTETPSDTETGAESEAARPQTPWTVTEVETSTATADPAEEVTEIETPGAAVVVPEAEPSGAAADTEISTATATESRAEPAIGSTPVVIDPESPDPESPSTTASVDDDEPTVAPPTETKGQQSDAKRKRGPKDRSTPADMSAASN